jgi:hypothetical protein
MPLARHWWRRLVVEFALLVVASALFLKLHGYW